MATIREDLIGAVHVDGHVLFAGDTVPKGADIHGWLLASKPAPKRSRKKKTPEPEPDVDVEGVDDDH